MNANPGVLKLTVILSLSMAIPERNALGVVVGTVVTHSDGRITYTYTVDNAVGTFDIAGWTLEVPLWNPDWRPTDQFSGGDVTVPNAGWYANKGIPILGGGFAQDFLSLDPASDILVGNVLGGFSIISSLLPELVPYYEFSADGQWTTGMTMGPSKIPVGLPDGGGPYCTLATGVLAMMTMGGRSEKRDKGCIVTGDLQP